MCWLVICLLLVVRCLWLIVCCALFVVVCYVLVDVCCCSSFVVGWLVGVVFVCLLLRFR